MTDRLLPWLLAALFTLVPAVASADAMCGGPRRPMPAQPPPPPSGSFATPPPADSHGAAGATGGRGPQREPTRPVELGMVAGMALLGGAAGLSSRKKPRAGG